MRENRTRGSKVGMRHFTGSPPIIRKSTKKIFHCFRICAPRLGTQNPFNRGLDEFDCKGKPYGYSCASKNVTASFFRRTIMWVAPTYQYGNSGILLTGFESAALEIWPHRRTSGCLWTAREPHWVKAGFVEGHPSER